MKNRLVIDRAGRVVLPQTVRKHFQLQGGSVMSLSVEADAIVLRPIVHKATLVSERGLVVHEGEPEADLVNAVEAAREWRDRDVMGGSEC